MWASLVIFIFVVAASAENAWKSGTDYQYDLKSRTMTALHQVVNQYTGILYKASVHVQLRSENILNIQVKNPQYAELHTNLSLGWASHLPENEINYQLFPLTAPSFELNLKNSAVKSMMVNKNIPNWELNFYKSIASQLQIDTQAENLQKSRVNNLPQKNSASGIYKTMEDSVAGECETLYTISPLQDAVYINHPQLAPQAHLRGQGELIDIVKTRNFSNCNIRAAYHFGITGATNWEPASTQMGNLLARSSVSRVVLSGTFERYTIQSSVTTSKIIVSPFIHNNQKGMVVSQMNLTLHSLNSASGSLQSPSNPQKIDNLVYEYNTASPDKNSNQPRNNHSPQGDDSDCSSSSSISSSSSSSDSSSSSNSNSTSDSSSSSSNSSTEDSDNNNKRIKDNKLDTHSKITSKYNLKNKKYNNKHKSNFSDVRSSSSRSIDNGSSEEKFRRQKKKIQSDNRNSSDSSSSSNSSSSSSSTSASSDSSSSSSSLASSSEEHSWQPKPRLTEAPRVPFYQLFVANQGKSIQAVSDVNTQAIVEKLSFAIADELQTPSAITGKNTLTKFSLLASILRTVDAQQLQKLTVQLFARSSSKASSSESKKYQSWCAFRDAVAEAGTGPALLALRDMIHSKKVSNEEAAQLISVLPNTARYPSMDYLNEFYKLATEDPEVRQQNFVNTSSILAFTELARRVLVNNKTAHNRYPVHAFGRVIPKQNSALLLKYIPKIAQMLRNAVAQGDSHKIQVFSMALGNLAHPRILNVFEPYFEGKQQISDFQRLVMVRCLRKMSRIYPKVARPVLFKMILNTAEHPEVRVAAVYQIMKTNPPAQILQTMAQLTNDAYQNKQVISAIQSSIRTSANAQSENVFQTQNQQLTKNARAAVNLLNPKNLGTQYSQNIGMSHGVNKMNLAYSQQMSFIGSDDSLAPSNFFYSIHRNWGGFKHMSLALAAMSSSSSSLLDHVLNQFNNKFSYNSQNSQRKCSSSSSCSNQHSNEWSPDKVASMLKLGSNNVEQVEANLLISALGNKRFFAIDNHTIEKFPQLLKQAANALTSGESFNYTKFYNPLTVSIAFPTASGLPFTYNLKAPTLVQIGGEAKAHSKPDIARGSSNQIEIPETLNVSVDIRFIYSSKTQSQMGFITPHNQRSFISGLDQNIQIYLPIRAVINVDNVNNKVQATIEPLEPKEEQNLFEYSTIPYTNKYNVNNLVRNVDEVLNNRQVIHIRHPNQMKKTFGQDSTGLAFEVSVQTEQPFIDFASLYNAAKRHDFISAMTYAWAEQSINSNNITLAFNPHKSTANRVKLTASYKNDTYFFSSGESQGRNSHQHSAENQEASSDSVSSSWAEPTSSTPDSQKRLEQFYNTVSAGIKNSSAMIYDLSAEFQGQTNAMFVATFALASSPVSPKAKALLFLEKSPAQTNSNSKSYQACFASIASFPSVPLMNFARAMDANPTSYVSAQLSMGEKCNHGSAAQITFKGKLFQSEERKRYVESLPLARLCKKQMQEGNTLQYACRNMTTQANQLDQASFSAHFERVSPSFKNSTYKLYSAIRQLAYPYFLEDLTSHNNSPNKFDMNINLASNFKYINISVQTPLLSAQMNNLNLHPYVQALFAIHPEYSFVERVLQTATRKQYNPNCVIDNNLAQTFDNKTYPIKLGNCWHAMFQYTPKTYDSNHHSSKSQNNEQKVSVFVRDGSSSEQKEAMIILEDNVISLKPSGSSFKSSSSSSSNNPTASVQINSHQVPVSTKNVDEQYDVNGEAFVQYYALPSGAVRVFAPQHGLEFQYDGTGVQILAKKNYRSKVRGLCGSFTNEPATDFTTPKDCIVQNPMIFAATYALVNDNCQGPSKELKSRIQQAPCYQNEPVFENYINDQRSKH